MMRVALVAGTYRPDRCGVAHYTARLRRALAARGVDSVVITDADGAAEGDPSVVPAVRGWRARDLPALVRAVRRAKADVLHVQHAAGTYGFRRAVFLLPPLLRAAGWRGPIVTTAHEYGWWEWRPPVVGPAAEWAKEAGQARGWWDREDGFLLTGSDAVVATHGKVEHVLRARLPTPPDRVRRIPIGPNVEPAGHARADARAAVLRETGWPEDAVIGAFFGFLHPVKGIETLLDAFRRVVDADGRARLLLAGGIQSLALRGEEADAYGRTLRERISGPGLDGRVRLTGWMPDEDASRCMAAADLGVLPFNHGVTEKSGSLLAMLAHGLPVVATAAEGAAADESALIRVPPRDPRALADALAALLADPDRRGRMGAAAREAARAFSWEAIASAHAVLYGEVLARRARSRARAAARPSAEAADARA